MGSMPNLVKNTPLTGSFFFPIKMKELIYEFWDLISVMLGILMFMGFIYLVVWGIAQGIAMHEQIPFDQ